MTDIKIYIREMAGPDAKEGDIKEIAKKLFQKLGIGTVKSLSLSRRPNPKFGNRKSGIVLLEFFDNNKADFIKHKILRGERIIIGSPIGCLKRISWTLSKAHEKKSKKPIEEEECNVCALERIVKEQQDRIDFLEKRMQIALDTLLSTQSNATDRSRAQSHVQSNEDRCDVLDDRIDAVLGRVRTMERQNSILIDIVKRLISGLFSDEQFETQKAYSEVLNVGVCSAKDVLFVSEVLNGVVCSAKDARFTSKWGSNPTTRQGDSNEERIDVLELEIHHLTERTHQRIDVLENENIALHNRVIRLKQVLEDTSNQEV